ncbi:MAG: hypothetical protein AAFX86_11595 [Pseudomonadota bacterium]
MRLLGQVFIMVWLALAGAGDAGADITHRVSFSVGPQILVWTDTGEVLRGERIDLDPVGRIAMPGPAPAEFVQTGLLVPVAAETSAGKIVRFDVASNTPFEIVATGAATSSWRANVRILGAGPLATMAGADARAEVWVSPQGKTVILRAPRRTAATPGAPRDQAVTVEIEWMQDPGAFGGPPPRLSFVPMR